MARLRAGEMDALREVYQLHATDLLGLARRLTGSVSDAEDVVQDLFVGLPEAIAKYQERGYLRAWLRRLTVRLALMRLRSGRLRREVYLDGSEPSVTRSDARQVHEALAMLGPDDRAIVVLKIVEGYDHAEIAELLGIRRNASEVRLHRALARLRKLLEEDL